MCSGRNKGLLVKMRDSALTLGKPSLSSKAWITLFDSFSSFPAHLVAPGPCLSYKKVFHNFFFHNSSQVAHFDFLSLGCPGYRGGQGGGGVARSIWFCLTSICTFRLTTWRPNLKRPLRSVTAWSSGSVTFWRRSSLWKESRYPSVVGPMHANRLSQ